MLAWRITEEQNLSQNKQGESRRGTRADRCGDVDFTVRVVFLLKMYLVKISEL